MPEVQWYYARNDQQFGPVSAAELKQLADAGRLAPDDLLWREGMDAWSTAINLRGLFTSETPADTPTARAAIWPTPQSSAPHSSAPQSSAPPATPERRPAAQGVPLRSVLRATQLILWSMCVLVVLAGVVLFTRAFLIANEPNEEAAAAAVFATFFIAAYVLARSGEKLSRLLLTRCRRANCPHENRGAFHRHPRLPQPLSPQALSPQPAISSSAAANAPKVPSLKSTKRAS